MTRLNDIVLDINELIGGVIPGTKTYGIARLTPRDKDTLPAVGETYVGLDDTHPVQVYHRVNGLTITSLTTGMGRQVDQRYTYQMIMIVFLNKSKTEPQDLVPLLQANLPQQFRTDTARSVKINFTAAVLNDQQIFTQEYKDTTAYRLGLNQRLMQVNYNLEVLYRPGCFAVCPEEKELCKNN